MANSVTRVLISGAAGFIGSNLVKKCLDEGWVVSGVDNMSNGHAEFISEYHNRFCEFLKCDFSHDDVLKRIKAKEYDVVFHLAALPRVSYSVEYPVETHDVNVHRTLKLIDACKGNVNRFVFASSSSVYGGAEKLPTPETYRRDPKSPYALQKAHVEDYLKFYAENKLFDSACLRFFNVFGPNALGSSPYATALAAWLTAIKQGQPMRSDGDGTQTRDMCHVDNVTDACVKTANYDGALLNSPCLNVACGEKVSNNEILNYLLNRYQGSSKIDAPWRAGDVMHTLADVSKANYFFGYKPIVKVWEGISRTCDWYDENWHWVKDLKTGV